MQIDGVMRSAYGVRMAAAKKSTKRVQTSQIQVRIPDSVKARLELAAAAAEAELQRQFPGQKLGVGPWMVSVCLREAERMGIAVLPAVKAEKRSKA